MYGSSTEGTNADGRHMQYFDYGDQLQFGKASAPLTRAIRAFTTSSLSTYSVAYNGNTSDGGATPSDGTAYASGATVTVAGNTGLLTKTGYTFDGWCTTQPAAGSACGGTSRAAASTFTLASHTTLYAVWMDWTAPTVSTLSPADNATNVAGDTNLVVTFSENVTAVAGKYVRICTGTATCTGSSVSGEVVQVLEATNAAITISLAQVTINPASDLSASTTYYLSIDSGAFRDAASNNYAGLTAGASWNFSTSAVWCSQGGECLVGDTGPGGGVVFYVHASGTFACGPTGASTCRYLEAAPTSGTNAWTDANYRWSGVTDTAIGSSAQYTAVGTGYRNTEAIVAQSGTAGMAGTVTRAYRGPNNLTDWYLPSKDELNELCKYARQQTDNNPSVRCSRTSSIRSGFSESGMYGSSTEGTNADGRHMQYFDYGDQLQFGKASAPLTRAIRAF
jgi:hypothetical protein